MSKVGVGKEVFDFLHDCRTQEEKQRHNQFADSITARNLNVFQIQMTPKAKIKYQPSPLFKVEFPNGWFIMLTDNQKESPITMLTIHGAPGDHREWAGLEHEMKDYCRWVNIIVPGFDGIDERRGTYSGSIKDFSKLVRMTLDELKIAQVILMGHSMGSIIAGFLFSIYPQYFRGYINVTGIVNFWYVGLKTFYRNAIGTYGFGFGPNRNALLRLLNKDEFRQKHHARFLSDTRQVYFGKVQFPALSITEMAAYIKIISSVPQGVSHLYKLNRELIMLRVLIFGKIDPLHQHQLTNEQIYSVCKGKSAYNNNIGNEKILDGAKEELELTILSQFGIKIESEKLQQYFCYHLEQTGHNAHKRRPKQMSKILRVYFVCIQILEKYQSLMQTSL